MTNMIALCPDFKSNCMLHSINVVAWGPERRMKRKKEEENRRGWSLSLQMCKNVSVFTDIKYQDFTCLAIPIFCQYCNWKSRSAMETI